MGNSAAAWPSIFEGLVLFLLSVNAGLLGALWIKVGGLAERLSAVIQKIGGIES